jgi:CRISPR-associated exonuclease Cas4
LQSIVDQLSVNELLQTRADLGRLGGLFKRWITENEKTKPSLGSKSGIFKFEYTLIDCASKESIPPYISLLNKFSIPYIVVYDKDHQQDKLQPARDVADRSSQKIEDTINNSFGKSVIFINDIEEELGIVAGNASKPYIALQEISQEEFAICTSLSEKITTIYE